MPPSLLRRVLLFGLCVMCRLALPEVVIRDVPVLNENFLGESRNSQGSIVFPTADPTKAYVEYKRFLLSPKRVDLDPKTAAKLYRLYTEDSQTIRFGHDPDSGRDFIGISGGAGPVAQVEIRSGKPPEIWVGVQANPTATKSSNERLSLINFAEPTLFTNEFEQRFELFVNDQWRPVRMIGKSKDGLHAEVIPESELARYILGQRSSLPSFVVPVTSLAVRVDADEVRKMKSSPSLIDVAKEIRAADKRAKEMGLKGENAESFRSGLGQWSAQDTQSFQAWIESQNQKGDHSFQQTTRVLGPIGDGQGANYRMNVLLHLGSCETALSTYSPEPIIPAEAIPAGVF